MARRIQTTEGTYCSGCGSTVDGPAGLCGTCGQPFEGDTPGTKCPQCGRPVDERETTCPTCGTDLPALDRASSETALRDLKAFRAETRKDLTSLPNVPEHHPPEDMESHLLAELEALWRISEPFGQIVTSRRKRLDQMDRLITNARRRVRELEASTVTAEVREREELKRQLQEVLLERDEILKIEHGITEMDRIYKNIIAMQQKELRTKEDSLRARLEGFRRELGLREQERATIADREASLSQREREIESRLAELEARESRLREAAKGLAREKDSITQEEWLAARKEIQDALLKVQGAEGEVGLVPSATAVRDLRMRVNELEEALEKAGEARSRLEHDLGEVRTIEEEAREVLRVLDGLLEALPDELVRRFARSESFQRYERLMARLGL